MINLKTENNKDIFIFDDVFPSHIVQKMYYFIMKSYFKIDGKDGEVLEQQDKYSVGISSNYTKDDLINFGLIENLSNDIKEKFKIGYETIDRCIVNVITPFNSFHIHDDAGQNTVWSLIYYANLKWDIEYGADTVFLKDNRKDMIQTVQCKPNRIVLFDTTIPHLIRPSTIVAPHYRFSINLTFRGENG
jgi:Rps23 Pro-64 3,4-dihydroxylase Tpa1-like proline 4-hydroxylase